MENKSILFYISLENTKTVKSLFQTRRKAPSSISTKYSHAENLDDLKQDPNLDYHKISLDELYQRFGTHPGTVSLV